MLSLKVTVKVTLAELLGLVPPRLMLVTVGGSLSTLKVVERLAPASWLPAKSELLPAATFIPIVPLPVQFVSVTVGVAVLPFDTTGVLQVASDDVLSEISLFERFIKSAPL